MAEQEPQRLTVPEALELGLAAFSKGDLARAHHLFSAVVQAMPKSASARWWLARTLNLMERCEEADREFEQAVADGVSDVLADYYRGVRALREKEYDEAERLADSLLARDDTFRDARLMGVRALGFQGRWHDAARKYGQRAAEEIANETYGKGFLNPFTPLHVGARIDSDMRKAVDEKPIQPNAPLAALLRKLPAEWVHSIAANLGLPKRRKVAETIAEAATALAAPETLQRLVRELREDERQALAYLLERGGVAARQAFSTRFGTDLDDSYWVGEREPQSVLGRLRDRGLVFTGRAPSVVPRGYALVIPAQLRPLIAEALGMEPAPPKPKGRAGK